MAKTKKTDIQKQAEKLLNEVSAPLNPVEKTDIFADFKPSKQKALPVKEKLFVETSDPLGLRKIFDEINNEYYENLKKEIQIYPCYTNRASAIGHPCKLKLWFDRLHWDKQQKIEPRLKDIFDLGKELESIIKAKLIKMGFNVREEQRPFKDDTYNLTGSWDLSVNHPKIDKIISYELWFPLDMKSMDGNIFNRIRDVKDIVNHRSRYIRSYITQLDTYIYFDSLKNQDFKTPFGLLALANKSNKEVKFIDVYLDLGRIELIFKKCEEINKAVAEKTQPYAEYNECCERCTYEHICSIPKASKDAKFIIDGEVNDKLHRREEIKQFSDEFKELDEEVKDYFKEYNLKENLTDFFTPDFEIILREQTRESGKYFRTIIKNLSKRAN